MTEPGSPLLRRPLRSAERAALDIAIKALLAIKSDRVSPGRAAVRALQKIAIVCPDVVPR